MADMAARPGAISRLRLGFGCCWATRVIALDHVGSSTLAASSAAGAKSMIAYAPHHAPPFSQRSMVLLIIVGLHALLIYGLATGLASKVVAVIPSFMHLSSLTPEVRTPEPPPPLSMPRTIWLPQSFDFPPPDVSLTIPDDENVIQAAVTEEPSGPHQQSTIPNGANRVLGGPGRGFPNTDDYYPAASKRLAESGVAAVRVCVDAKGWLSAEPKISQSSGIERLDESALRLAKAGSGHYRATTENGRSVDSCYAYRVRFQLHD